MQKPFYTVFLRNMNIPRKKYLTLSEAIIAANKLSKIKDRTSYIIEYTDIPKVLYSCDTDGTIGEMP